MGEHTNDTQSQDPSAQDGKTAVGHLGRGAVGKLMRPPIRKALLVLAIAITMAALFVISYSLVLGRPIPRHIPAGIVESAGPQPQLMAQLETATNGSLVFRPFPSASTARSALDEQTISVAVMGTPDRPQLLLSSAAGASVSRVVQQAGQRAQRALPQLEIIDAHPLPHSDPQGLVSFYVMLGATILGFLSMLQLRAYAPQLSLTAWLACLAVLAVVGGLVIAVAIGPLTGALPARLGTLWLASSLEITASGLFASTMLVLFGGAAIIPTWAVLVILGNTSSGGAVATPLLPGVLAFVGRFLPQGATVSILHTAAYFPSAQHSEPFLIQAVWIAGTAAALLLSVRLCGRIPTGRPVETPAPKEP